MYDYVHAIPVLFRVRGQTARTIEDNNFASFNRISIVDIVQDPESPLPDYGEEVNLNYVRAWYCAWSITVNLSLAFAGDNPANLFLEVLERVNGNFTTVGSRIRLPLGYNAELYHFKGDFTIHSQEGFFRLHNMTGQSLTFDWDVWAKAYP